MSKYLEQVTGPSSELDPDFWRQPEGVHVPDDELQFLLVPDAAEAMAVFHVAQEVQRYQREAKTPITCALMATMGGMLPGILLYDHLVKSTTSERAPMAFGSIGVSLYKSPNERYASPKIQQPTSIPIEGQSVLVIDDLGDSGGTMAFLIDYLKAQGAADVLTLAIYMKPEALRVAPADFYFGTVAQDTWIITPRELVETMAQRVPVWRERGATMVECKRRLIELIGYPKTLVNYYVPGIFAGPYSTAATASTR